MRILTAFLLATLVTGAVLGQAVYSAADYAVNGDTFYLTKAQTGNFNFDTGGAGITWNYSALSGTEQRRLVFRLPTQTGFSLIQWPYIYNSANVNVSTTDGQTIAVFGLQQTNPNDYFLKNTAYFRQRASSYTVVLNNISYNVKNVFDNADTIYKFPFTYNSVSTSKAAYAVAVPPDLYYRSQKLNRQDTVKGWGTVITPYGTFTNCLKYESDILQVDSVAVNGTAVIANDTTRYREIKWFDPSRRFQVLYVKQIKAGNQFITQTIEYLDNQQFYQPNALFAYLPASPNMGDTVNFQNFSTNGYTFKWRFGDPASGANDSSSLINPQHMYTNPGTYSVRLIAYNGALADTVFLPVTVSPINFTYTFTGNGNWSDAVNWAGNAVPPSLLPATNTIVIDPVSSGQCIVDIAQQLAAGAVFIVNPGKRLLLPGVLRIQ
jgi:PKD repeat protein